MKKVGFFLAMTCLSMAAFAQSTYTLKGKVKGRDEGKIYITYYDENNNLKNDSTAISAGNFEFKGNLIGPRTVFLKGTSDNKKLNSTNYATMFIEPGTMLLELTEGDYEHFKLSGSPMQDDYYRLMASKKSIYDEMKPLSEAYDKANLAYIKSMKDKAPEAVQDSLQKKANQIRNQFDPFSEKLNKIDKRFFAENPDSYVTAYLMIFEASDASLAQLEKMYHNLSPRVQKSSYAQKIVDEIEKLKKGSPGAMATLFETADIDGKMLSLANFKGKYVLLDFWASWCVPCREGNPHLKKLYAQYRDKGFEIIGISDDDSKPEAWHKAVKQDEIGIWKHVLRGLKRTNDGIMASTRCPPRY
ncbi:TlpA disulfide reductase family protein [Pedobacter sp. KR3-3]|uniref:TlpA disulfide reductase family protein n=1 Tax=Pedobacter albus TaxID=3113905 RepID=A0ABU7I649_9SPHI|nr:TlpA disulfide reductase family protein [Pedobacter sp. KR3-3]MEE1944786.1 TlpA disulfide reductase family protein [Pedobacter sp. KR3-3]